MVFMNILIYFDLPSVIYCEGGDSTDENENSNNNSNKNSDSNSKINNNDNYKIDVNINANLPKSPVDKALNILETL